MQKGERQNNHAPSARYPKHWPTSHLGETVFKEVCAVGARNQILRCDIRETGKGECFACLESPFAGCLEEESLEATKELRSVATAPFS